MAIYRGPGGAGDSTDDAIVSAVAELAADAAQSATEAAASASTASTAASTSGTNATNAATSASQAATSATNANTSAGSASSSATNAASSATAAAASATSASNSAASASTSASNASSSASTAASNATAAATSASQAATSASNATTAYNNTVAIYGSTTAVQNAVNSASTSATNAANSATAAATSATNAANSASSANTYAAAALNSANNANAKASESQTSANNAAASAASAANYANAAEDLYGSAAALENAVDAAQASATASANSATASANSATQATINGAVQVALATTQATNAANSATAAATSATNAATSATQAAASAASAAAIVTGVASNRPSIRPSLLLDFSNTKQLDPRITFSRPTTATYYDGKTVVKAEENLLTNSQTFATTWTLSSVGVTENAVAAPDGTSTAASVVPVAASASHIQAKSTGSITGVYTYSLYAKANGYNYLQMFWNGGSDFANFYLSGNGTVSLSFGAIASITSVGNDWYRCSITSTVSAYTYVYFAAVATGAEARAASYTADGTSGIYIWGAQLEQRSTVTAYTPTTTAPITNYIPALQTAASGVPRFDHDPVTGESKGLLIEEQRTNLLTYSTDFKNSAWSVTAASIESNVAIAPDGSLTASKVVEDSTNAVHTIGSFTGSYTNGTTYTYSVYLKAAGRTIAVFYESNWSGAEKVSFDLSAGTATVLNASYNTTASIQNVGNGWYRCIWSETAQSSGTGMGGLTRLRISNGSTTTYTGNGYSGIYIWGAQLEAGSFPTSYIPTVASQVTRSADSASMTGSNFSSWYSQGVGTVSCEYTTLQSTGYSGVWELHNSSNNNTFQALQNGTTFAAYTNLGGGVIGAATANYLGVSNKTAISFTQQPPACSVVENGSSVTTGTPSIYSFTPDQFRFGSVLQGAVAFNKCIKRIAYYPKRLSNTELQGVTS